MNFFSMMNKLKMNLSLKYNDYTITLQNYNYHRSFKYYKPYTKYYWVTKFSKGIKSIPIK